MVGVQGRVAKPSPRKLDSLAYLTSQFSCNFAHENSEYAKKSIGLEQVQMHSPLYPSLNKAARG